MSNYDSYKTRSDYDELERYGEHVGPECVVCGGPADILDADDHTWFCEDCKEQADEDRDGVYDARWKEDVELLGELYDEDDFFIDTSEFEKLVVEKELNSMIPVR